VIHDSVNKCLSFVYRILLLKYKKTKLKVEYVIAKIFYQIFIQVANRSV